MQEVFATWRLELFAELKSLNHTSAEIAEAESGLRTILLFGNPDTDPPPVHALLTICGAV